MVRVARGKTVALGLLGGGLLVLLFASVTCAQGTSCLAKSYSHTSTISGGTVTLAQANNDPVLMREKAKNSCKDALKKEAADDGLKCVETCEGKVSNAANKVCKATSIFRDDKGDCVLNCNAANTQCSASKQHRFACLCKDVSGTKGGE